MCKFGCDDLYEKGYITVISGKVLPIQKKALTIPVSDYIDSINGKNCLNWNKNTKPYFEWYNNYHSGLRT